MTKSFGQNLSYLIVGNGLLANHLKFYFQSQNIRIQTWNRKEHSVQQLIEFHKNSNYTLLCIKDSAIEEFILSHQLDPSRCIHFSGSVLIANTLQFHPLMTFSKNLFSIDFYSKFSFVGIKGQPKLQDIFPFLQNPYFEIEPDQKAFYHALCVLSGNFTNLLWKKAFEDFDKLQIPADAVIPYLEQIFTNIKLNHLSSLTGPIARKDIATLRKNLESLSNDPYHDVYKSFVKAYDPKLFQEINI